MLEIVLSAVFLAICCAIAGLIMENEYEIRHYLFTNKKCPTCNRRVHPLKTGYPEETT